MSASAPVVAVANQKGGVGKTAVTLGVASAASVAGISTLVVDMDPQGNATAALGVADAEFTVNDVLYADRRGIALEAVAMSRWPHVSVIPANLSLAQRDADRQRGGQTRLRKALDAPEIADRFGLVLIDCQPSVGTLVSHALIAASGVLIVTEPSIDASAGVANTMATIDTVRKHFNEGLEIMGVVLNKVPPRSREAEFRRAELREAVGRYLWEPAVPVRGVLTESRGARDPIHSYGSRAADLVEIFDSYLTRIVKEK
jgi:chromosome partitioning protein